MSLLTEKQVECLRAARFARISPWNYGSTTIATLKRLAFIEKDGCDYMISDSGRRHLDDLDRSEAREP